MVFNYDQQRRLYLENKISHEEFYLELADAIAFDDLELLVPESACKSKDPDLNDVPLKLWDYRFPAVRMLAKSRCSRMYNIAISIIKNVFRYRIPCVIRGWLFSCPLFFHETGLTSCYHFDSKLLTPCYLLATILTAHPPSTFLAHHIDSNLLTLC